MKRIQDQGCTKCAIIDKRDESTDAHPTDYRLNISFDPEAPMPLLQAGGSLAAILSLQQITAPSFLSAEDMPVSTEAETYEAALETTPETTRVVGIGGREHPTREAKPGRPKSRLAERPTVEMIAAKERLPEINEKWGINDGIAREHEATKVKIADTVHLKEEAQYLQDDDEPAVPPSDLTSRKGILIDPTKRFNVDPSNLDGNFVKLQAIQRHPKAASKWKTLKQLVQSGKFKSLLSKGESPPPPRFNVESSNLDEQQGSRAAKSNFDNLQEIQRHPTAASKWKTLKQLVQSGKFKSLLSKGHHLDGRKA